MKVAVAFALFIATVSAANFCVDLVQDDVSCEGFRTNFPAKVCNPLQANVSSATACDATSFFSIYNIWNGFCPLKNIGNQTFCEGKGYYGPYNAWSYPCLIFVGCNSDDDCNPTVPPVDNTPVAPPPLACYDCCLFCFDEDYCTAQVSNGIYAPPGNTSCTSCATEPICSNGGFAEITGYCNCYSGFTTDEADRQKCAIQPPTACQPLNEISPMENTVVPSIYDLHVSRNKLSLRVTSSFVANRRTLIEFPNPECNLINSPEFFEKTIDGCNDVFIVNAPFANCGFTLTSEEDVDIYSGEMHVKHIDRIVIDDNTIERVVDTPFNVVIRLPKNLAVASSVEIVATPGVPVKAAFVGQNVNVATQTGQLEFVTSLPAPLIVLDAQMVEAPYNVNPAVRLIGSNCSAIGYCLQHLVVDLDIQNCSISGVYKMVVTVGCSTQQNCPGLWDSPASTQLTATIAAQPTCGEASIDIGLVGQLQAYNDPAFSSPASSFDNGKTVHFLVSTYSDQVDISNVDLVSVWYTGSNVPGQFLFINDNFTDVGATNNFNYGQHSNSQVWFSFEATVSSPNSTDDTVFKLDKDEVGSYTFVAFIELQWNPNDATPSNANPFPLKKRVALEGTLSRQSSQLSSKVQITGPKNTNEDAVSVSSVVSGSVLALFVALISILLI